MKRILYFCPDFPQPSGGIKTLYRHVQRLCALGYDAYIVHQKRDFRLTWHAYAPPILWLSDRPQLSQDDVLVIPEVMHALMQQTQRFAGQRIVIALSWSPTYWGLKPGQSWRDFGITQVMTKSPLIQTYVRWSMGLDALLFHEFVDPSLYYQEEAPTTVGGSPWSSDRQGRTVDPQLGGADQERASQAEAPPLTVAYLTRKERSGAWLQGILQRRGAPLDQIAWHPLQNLDEADYAQQLRKAGIYLVTHLQEGMNSSVLEAMACGCLVVGYSGIGGSVYMQGSGPAQNCILVENGNLPALGETLERVLLRLVAQPGAYASVVGNGLVTARGYQDQAAEEESLRAIFDG